MEAQGSGDRQGVRAFASFTVLVASGDDRFVAETTGYLKPFGYQVSAAADSLGALEKIRAERPDVVLAEVELPPLTGFDLCRAVKQDPSLRVIPFILVTESPFDVESRVKGLQYGADDLLSRPLHEAELRARVRSALRVKAYMQQVLGERQRLEELVRERMQEVEEVTLGVVAALEKASTLHDTDTGSHLRRVSGYSETLARALGLDPALVAQLARYASLHDVGKVGLPDAVLKKEGKLTPEEYEVMKGHARMGYDLLDAARADPVACHIALYHHERFDGRGYPEQLRGDAIPIEARIVAMADVFDALTTRRCYKAAIPPTDASKTVLGESGRQFDPSIVRVFMQCYGEFVRILEQHKD